MLRQKFRDFIKLKHEKQERSASKEAQSKYETPSEISKLNTKATKYGETISSRPQTYTKNYESSSPRNWKQGDRGKQFKRTHQNSKVLSSNQRTARDNFQSKFFNTWNVFNNDFLVREDLKSMKNVESNTVEKVSMKTNKNQNQLFIKTIEGEDLNNDQNDYCNEE